MNSAATRMPRQAGTLRTLGRSFITHRERSASGRAAPQGARLESQLPCSSRRVLPWVKFTTNAKAVRATAPSVGTRALIVSTLGRFPRLGTVLVIVRRPPGPGLTVLTGGQNRRTDRCPIRRDAPEGSAQPSRSPG